MAAPKKNSFWKNRSKHGRDKLFETPELLWDAACEYFEWSESNPLIAIEYNAGKRVRLPKMRPFTLRGLCLHLECNTAYFRQLKATDQQAAAGFEAIIERIEDVIYTQKFEGAATGFFNANLISRDLGLADKVKTEGSLVSFTMPPLTPERIREIGAALEAEY